MDGADRAVLTIAVRLQVLDASKGGSLLESVLVAAALIVDAILFRLGVAETMGLVDDRVFILDRVAREVRSLRLLRLL